MPGFYDRTLLLGSLTWILSREGLISLQGEHQVITHLGGSRSSGYLTEKLPRNLLLSCSSGCFRCHYIAH